MITRRRLLGTILAACIAPGIVRASSLMHGRAWVGAVPTVPHDPWSPEWAHLGDNHIFTEWSEWSPVTGWRPCLYTQHMDSQHNRGFTLDLSDPQEKPKWLEGIEISEWRAFPKVTT